MLKIQLRDQTLRSLWMIPVIAVMLAMMASPFQAAWLKNLAVLKLQPAWRNQRIGIIDPPCVTQWEFPFVKKYIETSAVKAPHNPSTLTDLGRVLWLEGDCTGAIALWEQASLNDFPPAQYELLRIGDFETFSPDSRLKYADYAFWEGVELRTDPKNEAALQWFNRSFELVPQRRTINALVLLHQKRGENFDASGMWQKMIEVYPDSDPEHWFAVGELDYLNANWVSAMSAFAEGARLTSESYEFWLRIGDASRMMKNWEQAAVNYEHAIQVGPKNITAYLSLGTTYRVRQEYQSAVYWYSKAQELFPRVSDPYFFLGETYYMMGDNKQARQNLEAGLKIEPTNQPSMYILAQIYYQEGNPSLAEGWLVKAINHQPDVQVLGSWWLQLGDWRLGWHNCPGALEAFTNAIQAGENNVQQKMKLLEEVCAP